MKVRDINENMMSSLVTITNNFFNDITELYQNYKKIALNKDILEKNLSPQTEKHKIVKEIQISGETTDRNQNNIGIEENTLNPQMEVENEKGTNLQLISENNDINLENVSENDLQNKENEIKESTYDCKQNEIKESINDTEKEKENESENENGMITEENFGQNLLQLKRPLDRLKLTFHCLQVLLLQH